MPDYDELVAKWAQEKLLCVPLAADAASELVWEATVALRRKLSAVKNSAKVGDIVAEWSASIPSLAHNTLAGNQVRAAIVDLKALLGGDPQLELPLQPAQPAQLSDKENE